MHVITNSKIITGLAVLILMTVPAVSFARDNSLTGGLSTGFDFDDRNYDDRNDDDDYQRLFLTPMVLFRSLSERDSFELQATPSIRYDLKDSNTDWDSNLRAAANRFMTRKWQLGITNHYLKSDYSDTETESTDPQLSNDRGRERYWRNTLGLFSNYFYAEDSLVRFDVGYIVLRNDGGETSSDDEEYDRFTTSLRNEHRYNAIWRSTVDFGFVLGDFHPNDSDQANISPDDQLSDDLKEYRLSLALDNESIIHNPLSLSFDYIAARYDDSDQDDNDIYQMRLNWRRDYSSHMYTNVGAGPAYEKTEGQNGRWGGNGIAEVNYAVEHGSINFQVEKVYDVDNFSGNDQSGITDTWATRLSGRYQLQSDLTLSGRLVYDYEDREELSPTLSDPNQLDKYHEDRYIAGTGLSYTFLQFYTASVDYTYTKLDSDRDGESYDDHRLLLTLSWQKELFRW